MNLLTKSKYIIGLQCTRYLWTVFNHPELIPELDQSTQFLFDQGYEVEKLAKSLYKGITIPTNDFNKSLELTKANLKKKKPLFEPSFQYENLYARADILVPIKNQYDIIEIKQGTKPKEEHIHDVSFQKYVYEKSGLKIRKCFILHVNNEYVKKGKINPKKLLKLTDITKEVESVSEGLEQRIKDMLNIINSKEQPEVTISKSCTSPHTCPIKQCWSHLPEHHVFHLYRGGKTSEDLYSQDIYAIEDIPDTYKLSDKQSIQRKCEKTKKPYIQKEALKHFLKTIKDPVYFLDFETFATAIPVYDGTHPYQAIPFQFSLHVKDKHISFLHKSKSDPRLKFLKALKKNLGDKGTILVYNQSFEKGRLNELAEAFPEYKKWVQSVLDRFVDLLIPFRNFYYYNPKQKGSASIKAVLPAITGKGYKDLDIAGGSDASASYYNAVFKDSKGKAKVFKDLEKYCGLDTEGMVWILDELRKMV